MGFLKDFFQGRFLAQQLLCGSQHVNGIVNTNSQNDGGHKDRKRIQLAVEHGCKGECRNAGVQHGGGYKNRPLDPSKEIGCQKDDQNQTDAKGEYTVVGDFVNFLKSFVCTVYGKTGGNGESFSVEMLEKGIRACKNVGDKFVIRRRLDEFCVHNAVEQDFSRAVWVRATDET